MINHVYILVYDESDDIACGEYEIIDVFKRKYQAEYFRKSKAEPKLYKIIKKEVKDPEIVTYG